MIAYCPLEELEPPVRQRVAVEESVTEEVKSSVGLEETEMNYVVMAFIVGVIVLAVSDSIRA